MIKPAGMCTFYSKVRYDQLVKANIEIGLGSLVALTLLSMMLVTLMTRPVLDLVGRLVYAMSEIKMVILMFRFPAWNIRPMK